MDSEAAAEALAAPSPRRSTGTRWVARLARAAATGLLAISLTVLGLIAFALGSAEAARWLADRVVAASQGRLSIESLSGNLWLGLAAERVVWRDRSLDLQIDGLRLRPDWGGLLRAQWVIAELSAQRTQAVLGASVSGPADGASTRWSELMLPLDLRLESLQLDRIELSGPALGANAPWVVERLEGSADYRPGRLRIERLLAVSRGVEFSGSAIELVDRAPHSLSGQIRLEAPSPVLAYWLGLDGVPDPAPAPTLRIELSGSLETLSAQLRASAWGANSQALLTVSPFATDLPLRVEGSFESLDLHALTPKAPKATLRGQFSYAAPAQSFEVSVRTTEAQSLDRQGLPFHGVQVAGALLGPSVRIDRLAIELREAGPALARAAGRGRVTGKLQIDRDQLVRAGPWQWPALTGELTVTDLDLRGLATDWPTTRASGRIVLEPRRLNAQLSDTGLTADPLTLQAEIGIEQAALRIDQAALTLGPARASAQGRVSLVDQGQVELAGHLARIDSAWLSGWLPAGVVLPQAQLGGAWRASRTPVTGATRGPVPLALALTIDPESRLAGAALTGTAKAELVPGRVRALDVQLAQGTDRLSVSGSLGAADDRLRIAARLVDLGRFVPQLTGPAQLDAELYGGLEMPAWKLSLSAGPIDPAQASPSADRLGLEARLTAEGTAAEHAFELTLRVREETLNLTGRGALPESVRAPVAEGAPARWRATLDRVRVSGSLPAVLERPAQLRLGESGSIELRDLSLSLGQGRIWIEALRWQDGIVTSSGQLVTVSLAPFADRLEARVGERVGATPPDATARDAAARLRALQISGEWALSGHDWKRTTGDVAFEVKRTDAATVGPKAVDPVVGESRLRLKLREGALSGEARLTVPSLAFTRALTAPDWIAEGALVFDGRIAGTIERPELDGQMNGEGLMLVNRSLGWRLRDGRLVARLEGRVLRIVSLRFLSGERGVVELTGEIEPLAEEGRRAATPSSSMTQRAPFNANLGLRLDRFIVPLPPGQRLVLSGQTRLLARDGQVSWTGLVNADEGLIEFGNLSAPDLPADLVIVDRRLDPGPVPVRGASRPNASAATAPVEPAGWLPTVEGDLRIALGERLRVQGGGLDARLTGELTLAGRLPREPRVSGRVQLRDGTFQAYGRKLDLTRGELRFGGEVDNPFIDIVALRRNQEVSAGVSVTGPARSPRVRLVSEPDLPDAQKLSWLVLGTGLEDAAAAGQALALREAALNLLGDDDGGLAGGLSQALGIDSVSFGRSVAASRDSLGTARLGAPGLAGPGATAGPGSAAAAGSVRQEVVSVSKRLDSRLTLSYERGLQGLWNLVRLQYEISNRLLLRAQSGSENAIDLLYFWWFD